MAIQTVNIPFNLKHVNIHSFTMLSMYSKIIFFGYKSADGSYRPAFLYELYLKYTVYDLQFWYLTVDQEFKTLAK